MTPDVFDLDSEPGTAIKQRAPRLVALSAGRLGLWGKPAPHRLAGWRLCGLTTLVTLLSEREGALNVGQAAQNLGLEWLWFDQRNADNLPSERQAELFCFLERINERIDSGAWVLMHCAAGQHRTGMAAYALLRLRGLPPVAALELIRLSRPVTYENVGEKRIKWVESWLANRGE